MFCRNIYHLPIFKKLPFSINLFRFGSNKSPFERKQNTNSPFQTKKHLTQDWLRKNPQNKPVQIDNIKIEENFQLKKNPTIDPISSQAQPQEKPPTNPFYDNLVPKVQVEVQKKSEPQPLNYGGPLSTKKDDQAILTPPPPSEVKVDDLVMSNIGLNRYLTRIYATSGLSLILTLASAYACINLPFLAGNIDWFMMGGAIASFLAFQKAKKIAPTFYEEKLQGDTIYRTKNSIERLAIYSFGCITLGASASPLLFEIHQISNTIIPMTMGITASIFGGASLMGFFLPKSYVMGYSTILGGGMLGLLGLNASGLLAGKFLGYTLYANTLSTAESYLGIGLFTMMIVYDTHVAIKRYQKGDADHLGMSIQLLLDLWNLIIRIAASMAKDKKK